MRMVRTSPEVLHMTKTQAQELEVIELKLKATKEALEELERKLKEFLQALKRGG